MADPATDARPPATAGPHQHFCPWWLGYLLISPLRRLFENPDAMLRTLVRPGTIVLEPGCGMGFFSLPLARLVGPAGKVVCVDLQQKMIDGLRRRARKAGLLDRIETAVCGPTDLAIGAWKGRVDLALAIHMVHEVPDKRAFLRQVYDVLRPGGRLALIEPKGHVSPEGFEKTVVRAEEIGFARGESRRARFSLGIVLSKPA